MLTDVRGGLSSPELSLSSAQVWRRSAKRLIWFFSPKMASRRLRSEAAASSERGKLVTWRVARESSLCFNKRKKSGLAFYVSVCLEILLTKQILRGKHPPSPPLRGSRGFVFYRFSRESSRERGCFPRGDLPSSLGRGHCDSLPPTLVSGF